MGLTAKLKVDPRKKMLKVLDGGDYIPFLSLTVTYFELFSFQILQKELIGIISREILNGLSTHVKIILLRVLDIIDKPTYLDMLKIKKRRNNMIHPKKGVMVHPSDKDKELMDRALEIIGELLNKI